MNITIVTDRDGRCRAMTLSLRWLIAGLAGLLLIPVMVAVLVWQLHAGSPQQAMDGTLAVDDQSSWPLGEHERDSEYIREESRVQLEHMTQQLARLQTRLSRLDALGERITELADLSDGEFDFNTDSGMGGPELPDFSSANEGEEDVQAILDRLSARIEDRTLQLRLLEELMLNRKADANATLDFMPVQTGYISSGFGRRTDPITQRSARHAGLDFAAPRGTPIHAVGAGVVTFAGRHGAFGNLVEISHTGGYKTRYAHAHTLEVSKGDLVSKGQQIATVGSTGRSTGPHLHLEVHRHGMALNPARFLALN